MNLEKLWGGRLSSGFRRGGGSSCRQQLQSFRQSVNVRTRNRDRRGEDRDRGRTVGGGGDRVDRDGGRTDRGEEDRAV